MARVRLEQLQKVFGKDVVVHDVSLEVNDGEFVVLVGPSGCGKSTTLRMIAGLESISSGRLFIGDRQVNDLAPKDRDIAMVFQNYALYPHKSVFENMAFALRLRKLSHAEIDKRVRDAAEILGLTTFLDRTPRALSGGQRQRVAIGRAIVRQPQVFLFDEPLSNLDAKMRVQMRREIASLQRRLGVTTIYVTHDQVEAMTMGDRIVVMSAGRIMQVGAPLELYQTPRNVFVATFIGSPAMNLLPGDGTRAPVGTLLGIRPEDLHLVTDGASPAGHTVLDATLDVVEPLGGEIVLHAKMGEAEITARIAPVTPLPKAGDHVRLAVPNDRLHHFDATSGERV